MMRIKELIRNPKFLIKRIFEKYLYRLVISDKLFVKIKYRMEFGKKLDLRHPVTLNEKMQWLKLYDRQKKYTKMVDKYEAKKYVSSIIGSDYIIPTLGIYKDFDDINFEQLPEQFVIKCTHDSGGIVICHDKSVFDFDLARKKIKKSLRKNYYYHSREWPYKNIKPRVIVEKYMEDSKYNSMVDYKFFCFNGRPEIMYMSEGLENHNTARMSFFDMNFNIVDCKRKDYELLEYKPNKPINFEKMKQFAAILSKNIPHLRVDFYEIDGKLYFGELTFFTCSGFIPFENRKWDEKLGNLLSIKTDIKS